MAENRPYRRIMLKLSGEMLVGKQSMGIQPEVIGRFADEVKEIHQMQTRFPHARDKPVKHEL